MKAKLLIYIFIILFLIFLERGYNLLSTLGMGGNVFFISLFLIYGLFLYLEVKTKVKGAYAYKQVARAGFIFSFWIGVVWGIIFSFSHGGPRFNTLPLVMVSLTGYAFAGGVFGLIGWGLAGLMWKLKRGRAKGI